MPSPWEYFMSLFKQSEESSPSRPLLREPLVRTEEEKADYLHWRETLVCRRLVDWLRDQYAIYQVLPDDVDEGIDFLDHPSSKGFVVHFHKTNYSARDLRHFLEYLRECTLALNYRSQMADLRSYEHGSGVETSERYYLKPRPNFQSEGPYNQSFGNVMIEVIFRNEQPYHLRFSATSYQDRLYTKPLEFREMMVQVLG
jgi:hypothetical protein